jgi:hypothetical protein
MFNNEKKGLPIAYLDKPNNPICFYNPNDNDDENIINSYEYINIPQNERTEFKFIPNLTKERFIYYITGKSGSGKSYFINEMLTYYKKKRPNSNIYLFSAKNDDNSLDEKLMIKRVIIDESLIDDPITIYDFNEDDVVIFDDHDNLEKKIKLSVIHTLNQILELGRSYKLNCIVTNHLPTNGNDTKRIINEAHGIIYFPHFINQKGASYLLEKYQGLTKKEILKIKDKSTRWAVILNTLPEIVITQKNIFTLKD